MPKKLIPFVPITVKEVIEQLQALNMPDAPCAIHCQVGEEQDLLQRIKVCNTINENIPYDKGDDVPSVHPNLVGVDIVYLSGLGSVGVYVDVE